MVSITSMGDHWKTMGVCSFGELLRCAVASALFIAVKYTLPPSASFPLSSLFLLVLIVSFSASDYGHHRSHGGWAVLFCSETSKSGMRRWLEHLVSGSLEITSRRYIYAD